MWLRRIAIENFRGIRAAAVDLDPTTALVGENSAGKTTILDALAICASGHDDRVNLELRDFHKEDGATSEGLRIALTFQEAEREWRLPAWAPFVPFMAPSADGRRELCLDVQGTRDPATARVDASWTFASAVTVRRAAGAAAASQSGLLATWRRLCPVIRLRGNRYFEQDPRDAHEEGVAQGPPERVSADPVAWRLEQQIRLVYERLTGAADIPIQELREGLSAVEAYLSTAGRPRTRARPAPPPRLMEDVAETPVRAGRPLDARFLSSVKQGAGARGLALVALMGAVLEARRHRGRLTDGAQPIIVIEDAEAHLHPIALSAMWELIASLPAQKIVTTNSGELLAAVPLRSIRRIVTGAAGTRVYRIDSERYSVDDLRRIGYHVRINRAGALFARCWILVEGETEAWLVPELAQVCGYDLPAEGIRCVEFAQSGVRALLRLANDLGIAWHLLADGDEAGRAYVATARAFLAGRPERDHVTALVDRDVEHCLFHHGYAHVYRDEAGPGAAVPWGQRPPRERATSVITRAVRARSKPGLALALLEAANAPGAPPVPGQLRTLIETAVRLAREE